VTSHSNFDMDEIGLEILTYLLNNQDSRDTLEGIIQWWLLERYIRQKITLVRKVLLELVSQGLIVEINNPNTQTSYQINKDKIQEIREALKGKT